MNFIWDILGFESSPPTTSPVGQNKKSARVVVMGELDRITQTVLPRLLDADNPKKRSKELSSLGTMILQTGKNWPKVNWRQFALMHNASIIRHTKMEGGEVGASVDAWKSFFDIWARNEGHFFLLNLDSEQLGAIHEALDDLSYCGSLIPYLSHKPLGKKAIYSAAERMHQTICLKLDRKGKVYLPLGYRHGVAQQGHAIMCKLVQEKNGSVTIHILNLGDGSEAHPTVNFSTSQDKISFRYYPIRVPKQVFRGEMGRVAFCHIIRYLTDPPDPSHHHYTGEDLYDIFHTLGTVDPNLGPYPHFLEAKGQSCGNCSDKGVKNVIHDVLLDRAASPKTIKKLFLNHRLCSLIAGSHTYLAAPDTQNCLLLRNAAEEFGVALEKLKSEIEEGEYLGGLAALQVIKKMTKRPPKIVQSEEKKPQKSPISSFSISHPKVEIDLKREEAFTIKQTTGKKAIQTYRMRALFFDITRFSEQLDEWIALIQMLPLQKAFFFLADCTRTLPIPEWGKKDVWDTIPPQAVKEVLEKFAKLLWCGFRGEKYVTRHNSLASSPIFFIDHVLASHTLYVIADKLARRCPWTLLDGFASPFIPQQYPWAPSDFTTIPLAEENHRYSQISLYFKESRKKTKGAVIFPIEPILSVEKYLEDAVRQGAHSQGTHHIRFLQKHLFHLYPKATNKSLSLFINLWKNSEGKLPPEIGSLYYLACVSGLLFFSDSDRVCFPERLKFLEETDDAGKQSLVIETSSKKSFYCHPIELTKREREIAEGRFDEMRRGYSELSLSHPYYRQMKTNGAVNERLSERDSKRLKIAEPIYRDLLRITRNDNLKLPLALEWALANNVYMNNHEVQILLEHCFFSPPGLFERLREEPLLLERLRAFVLNSLNYYRDNPHHLSTILFLLRIGIFFEAHSSALYGPINSEERLLYYKNKIDKLLLPSLTEEQQNEVILHRILVQTQRIKRSDEETLALLKDLFKPPIIKNASCEWLVRKRAAFMRKEGFALQEALLGRSFRNRVCTALAQHLYPSFLEGEWVGEFPTYSCREYTLDFLEGTLVHREKGDLRTLAQIGYSDASKEKIQKYGDKFWYADGQYESLDGKFRFRDTDGYSTLIVEREILIEGEKRWVRSCSFDFSETKAPSLEFLHYPNSASYTYYAFLDKREGDPFIIAFDSETDKPVFRIDYISTGLVITSVDERGIHLPIKMMNPSEIKGKKDPLYNYTLRFVNSNVLCFINTKTHEIEELNFFLLKLQFKRTDLGLESMQFPGFYLLANETLEELNHFSATFILQNSMQERKVLIPDMDLEMAAEDFSKEVKISKKTCWDYFQFDVDPLEGTLKSKDLKANLYLALLLKMQRDEIRALKYLQRVKTNTYFDRIICEAFSKFTRLSDRSPSALAFNARLIYIIMDNLNFMLEGRFGKRDHEGSYKALLAWSENAYIDYIKAISGEELSAIPKDLRLKQEEERAILRTLKRITDEANKTRGSEKDKRPFPQLLALRYQLLCANKKSVTTTISPKKVLLTPSVFGRLLPTEKMRDLIDSWKVERFEYGENRVKSARDGENLEYYEYPNRISYAALCVQFPTLYERARRCQPCVPDPFDFTLLACLKVKHNNNLMEIGHLLFYVRHLSSLFKDLTFEGVENDKDKIAIFKKIVERVVLVGTSEDYKGIEEELFKASSLFDFERKVVLSIPPAKVLPHSQQVLPASWDKTPFKSLRKHLFKRQRVEANVPPAPLFLDQTLAPQPETLESDLVDKFKVGYEELKKRENTIYHFHVDDAGLEAVKNELKGERGKIHSRLVVQRGALIRRLNTPFAEEKGKLSFTALLHETTSRLQKQTHQKLTLLPETIMKEVILSNNSAFLAEHCPQLKPDERIEIIGQVCDYYHLLVLYCLCGESIEKIEKLQVNPLDSVVQEELALMLDYTFLDPRAYPEISYFKVTEGKLPRRDQVEIYKWFCEGLEKNENRLGQYKAGGGKTVYITPLLMLRAKMRGLMPIFFTTPMIYSVDRVNLSFTMGKLEEDLCYLEVGLHTKLSVEDIQFIYEQLLQYHRQGRGLIMTPQTYYALRLQYYVAGIKEKNVEKVKYFSLIFHLFETKCLQLGDEAHRNYDSLTRAIFGVGDFFTLPPHENALFMALLKPLLGFEEVMTQKGQSISTLSRLGKNLLGSPSDEEIKEVQKALAKHMSTSPLLNIPEESRAEFIAYWTDRKMGQPQFLIAAASTNKESADLCALTSYFILDLLPQIVKLRTELDHSPSIFEEEEFDTPCHHKTPSMAQYEDPYLSSALSVKGTSHRALTETQIRNLLVKLLEKDWKDHSELGLMETESAQVFAEWVTKSDFKGVHLRDISLSDPVQMEKLTKILCRNPQTVEHYLTHFILPKIGFSLEQLTCTPAHLLYGFKLSVLFTATPLAPLIYPRALNAVRFDALFEAEVASQYCLEENQSKMIVDTPETFYSGMTPEDKAVFQQIDMYIDPSGFWCDFRNEEVAEQWLLESTLEGVLYFKEGRSLSVNKDERIVLILRSDPKKKIELNGSNIVEALAEHHLDWHKLRLGTYFDASHTESANIRQKVRAKAFIFVGGGLSSSRLTQALMRARDYLDKKVAQNSIWVYPKAVAQKIPLGKAQILNGPALFAWTVQNEKEQIEKRIVLAAFQEISFKVEREADLELKQQLRNPEEQIRIMSKYAPGLLEQNKHDPYHMYGEHEGEEATGEVLKRFAAREYAKFSYSLPFENSPLEVEIKSIIADVEKRIATLSTNWGNKLSLEVEQQTRLKKETEQKQYRPRPFDPIKAEGIYGNFKITHPDYPYKLSIKAGRVVFQTQGLTDHLYLELNQLHTAIAGGTSLEEKFLKPIDFFLIIITKEGKKMAVAHSNDILSGTLEKLKKGTDDPEVKHRTFLVTSQGTLIQKGHGSLTPSQEEVDQILQSVWMQDLIIDAALLRGQVVHSERLLERMKSWKDFPSFWERVVEAQPNPETANRRAITLLLEKAK